MDDDETMKRKQQRILSCVTFYVFVYRCEMTDTETINYYLESWCSFYFVLSFVMILKKGNVFVPVNKNKSRRDKNRMGGKPLFTILLFLYFVYRKHNYDYAHL